MCDQPALKELEGNPGKRQLNERESKPKIKVLSCPKWLDNDAKEEFISKHGAIVKNHKLQKMLIYYLK